MYLLNNTVKKMHTDKNSSVGLSCMARRGSANFEFSQIIPRQISVGLTRSLLFQYQTRFLKEPFLNKNLQRTFTSDEYEPIAFGKIGIHQTRVYVCAFFLIAEYSLITHFGHGHKPRPPKSLVSRAASKCYSSSFVDGQPPTGFRKNCINIRYICQTSLRDPAYVYATMFDLDYGIPIYSAYYVTKARGGQFEL